MFLPSLVPLVAMATIDAIVIAMVTKLVLYDKFVKICTQNVTSLS